MPNYRRTFVPGGTWQRHYWEHLIRDEADYEKHMNYIHYNPVKNGHVRQVRDWPYSTFYRYLSVEMYLMDWGGDASIEIDLDN